MAQMHRQTDSPRTPAAPSTVEQLLRGETSKWSPRSTLSSSSMFSADHDLENDQGYPPKKSVLMKMKDKAKKLRNSFSKRRHGEDIGASSSLRSALEDEDEKEEDAERHGAPMDEAELTPNEQHKDSARNHQNPKLFSDKNVLASIHCKSTTSPTEKPHRSIKDKSVAMATNVIYNPSSPKKPPSPIKGAASVKPPSPRQLISQTNMIDSFPSPKKATQSAGTSSPMKETTRSAATSSPMKATTRSVGTSSPNKATTQFSGTSSPSKAATQFSGTSSPSKAETQFSGTSSPSKAATKEESYKGESASKAFTSGTAKSASDKQTLAYPTVSDATHAITSKIKGVSISEPVIKEMTSASASAPVTPQNSSPSVSLDSQPLSAPAGAAKAAGHSKDHLWEKGVSVKEYIMNKFEPGEDERALSRVISEAMSPRKSPGGAGVVDKVREVVSSLLRNDDSPERSMDTQSANDSSTQVPVSTNPQEVSDQEENQGRILQAN